MTILFLSRLFYPHIGGVEKHVLKVSEELIKKGHNVIVITEQHDKKLSLKEEYLGIKIYRISFKFVSKKNWIKKFNIWFWFWKNRKLIENADIIHCHDVFFWYLPFRFLYPSKKVFTTFHGYEGNNLPTKKAIFMHKIAEKLSKGNICVGDFLKKWYGTKPTYTTYGSISIIQNSKFKIQNYNSKLKIMFLGRLEEETGIKVYLESLKILSNKGYGFSFVVFGDGSLKEYAKKFSKENKLEIIFKDFVKDAEKYIDNYNFVFTSRYLGILEAMGRRKNIFSVYNSDIKEDYLKMTPFAKWIIIERSPKKLAEEIEHFITHQSKNAKKIKDAYEWVKQETWNKMTNVYLELWKI